MIFDKLDIHHCEGSYLAHSLLTAEGRIAKGTCITAAIVRQLVNSGTSEVLVAKLQEGDVHENEAALSIARHLQGTGVTLSTPRTGRVNLLASIEGLCHFDAGTIIAANAIDEGITIATLPENRWIARGRMIATIKIIPYAVKNENVLKVINFLHERNLSVAPAVPHKAELIQTRLSSVKETVLDKTRRVTENRLIARSTELVHETRCDHNTESLSAIITETVTRRNPDWILIVGASAISDRADVIPRAIVAAGGTIDRYGIPVDPGNLLLLAHIEQTLVVGLPGCARSPRYNGLDMIFDRMACEVPVTNQWLSSLSVGGLLAEIADRPAPRISTSRHQEIGAVILAAGSSRRAGPANKLLTPYNGQPMVAHIAQTVVRSQASRVIAVTGHQHSRIVDALSTTSAECVYNTAHESGMASSVVMGISELTETDGILVCLGDMPHITTDIINQIIQAFKNNPDKSIFVPSINNQRGNPVLFTKVFYDSLLALEGDTGAKKLVQQYPDEVFEVDVEDNAVLLDYDTEEALSALSSRDP
ncbi:MAG: NTP transferase domain-containing protein [Granulosicoccus sp.]